MEFIRVYDMKELCDEYDKKKREVKGLNFDFIPVHIQSSKYKKGYMQKYIKKCDVIKYIRLQKQERRTKRNAENRKKQLNGILTR